MSADHPDSRPPRKRLRRRESTGPGSSPRFLTFSCYRRLQLFGTPALRDVFVESCSRAYEKGEFLLVAWVVMPEHIHLLVTPRPRVSWVPIAAGIKTSVSKRILRRWQQNNAPILQHLRDSKGQLHFWQPGGGFDRNVRDQAELEKEIRYIHRNPVERGLVQHPTEWAWSSARFWAARRASFRHTPVWERATDQPEHSESWASGPADIYCDWPQGDWRSWALWDGFI